MLIPSIFPVTCNTKHVGPGSTFVAIKGFKEDGAKYIPLAIEHGATTIIVDKTQGPIKVPPHINVISVDDTRQALATYTAQALGNPAQKLKFIGITGTAGKTTTTYLIDHILTQTGFKTALLGSIKNKIGEIEEESSLTTPESDYIHMFLAECVKHNVDYVIMETSSHSIALSRIYGIAFDAVGFTNLSPEHMDFHPTMEHYFQTKAKLFEQLKQNGIAVINTDNEWGQRALERLNRKIYLFGAQKKIAQNQNYTQFSIIQNDKNGIILSAGHSPGSSPGQALRPLPCQSLFGAYNAYNITMASLICSGLGVAEETIAKALATFPGVPGRLQLHTLKNGAQAFVDYAHKPGAFEEVLKTLRPLSSHLTVVFGCGGDRDKTKRPVMGKLAADYADLIIVTDDNPRNEDPQTIANEILAGIPQEKMNKVHIELDRRKAIELAAARSNNHSIIAILGKGHENYHLVKGQKFHLDDMEEIKQF